MNPLIEVLFCDKNSIYKDLKCDCYDFERNAINCKSEKACIYNNKKIKI